MQDIINFLAQSPILYLATTGLDNKPKSRPFMFCVDKNNKLWFCTKTSKQVYKELLAHPYCEFSTSNSDNAWLRLSGKAVFSNDQEVKEVCLQYPIFEQIYQSPDNPLLAVFYLDECTAAIDDFSGNPPKQYA